MAKHRSKHKKNPKRSKALAVRHRSNPPARHRSNPGGSGLMSYSPSSGGMVLKIFALPSVPHLGGGVAGEILVPFLNTFTGNIPVIGEYAQPGTVGYAISEALIGLGLAGVSRRAMPKSSEALAIVTASRLVAHIGYIVSGGMVGFASDMSNPGLSAYFNMPVGLSAGPRRSMLSAGQAAQGVQVEVPMRRVSMGGDRGV